MTDITIGDIENHLAHFGIKGMKWGVVRERNSTTGRVSASSPASVGFSNKAKIATGAAFVAAMAAKTVAESGDARRLISKGKAFIEKRDPLDFPRDERLADKNMSADAIHSAVVKPINPNYSIGHPGAFANCRRATFAYELRRRGYDVRATHTSNASGQNIIGFRNATTPNQKEMRTGTIHAIKAIQREREIAKQNALDVKNMKETPLLSLMAGNGAGARNKIKDPSAEGIYKALSEQPNRSRGELGVVWDIGGGHSVAYEVIDRKPVIFDAQSGKKLENPSEFKGAYKSAVGSAGFSRLDNVELNHDYLLKWTMPARKKAS